MNKDRIREHINVFINAEKINDIKTSVGKMDEVHIITSLSGG